MGPQDRDWDVIVIGAGMGGGTLGGSLARQGRSVLFIEQGEAACEASVTDDWRKQSSDPAVRIGAGRWPHPITLERDGRTTRFFAPMGCGVGGSTLLFAAALERFERADFSRGGVSGAPQAWPVGYDEFEPYYDDAERLYRVRGTPDPLNADDRPPLIEPAGLNTCDAHFMAAFERCGLHPYHLHIGVSDECRQCAGAWCQPSCRIDSRKLSVVPAVETGRAEVLERCEAMSVQADRERGSHVVCRCDGVEMTLRARVIVLAAGAYLSPALLLRSANAHWPQGLGNDHDQVGRNIMFHVMDLLAVWPRRRVDGVSPGKTIAVRDFYCHDGEKFGMLQSLGMAANTRKIVEAWRVRLNGTRLGRSRATALLLRIPAWLASRALGKAAIFTTVLEDPADPDNRVLLDAGEPSGFRVLYRTGEALRLRANALRSMIRQRLRPHRLLFLNAALELNFGHPCGTCRFGADPATSVLDRSNRVHGLENVYVVDASFMPSSGGANPALTIAANALRVADIIHGRLGELSDGSDRPAR